MALGLPSRCSNRPRWFSMTCYRHHRICMPAEMFIALIASRGRACFASSALCASTLGLRGPHLKSRGLVDAAGIGRCPV